MGMVLVSFPGCMRIHCPSLTCTHSPIITFIIILLLPSLLTFITLLFALATINVACNTRFTQLQFIDNRNFPGGPNAWLFAFYSIGVNTAGNASYVIANAFTDGLLVGPFAVSLVSPVF